MDTKKNKKKKIETPETRKHPSLFGVGSSKLHLIESLGNLVNAGVPVVDALTSIRNEIRSKPMRAVVDTMILDITNGQPVWRAFEYSHLFNKNIIGLIRIGEESGKLSENLAVVADHEKKNREFTSRIKSAMMYPVFVMIVTVVVGVGIAWFVLPKLATVFIQLDLDLPTVTRVLINIGIFLAEYGHIAVPIFIALCITTLYFIFFYRKTRHLGRSLLFLVPGIRNLIRDIELARLGFLFGSLLSAGMPIAIALESIEDSSVFRRYQTFYAYLRTAILSGKTFQTAFTEYKHSERLVPLSVQQIIYSGEKSGSLIKAFLEIGRSAEVRSENVTKNIAVILEPILLVIVWLGVVALAFAVILPIYQLLGGFGI